MCGLNVLVNGDLDQVVKMNSRIAHRGLPGFRSTEWAGPFGLGHVRLPIVGRSSRFNQPYKKNGWTFLFVGEIVNYKDFDQEAESDVQVLADMWSEVGPECVRSFDGFWAIAAVRRSEPHILHVVTDFLAKKPLYMFRDGPTMAISSEIKAFLDLTPLAPDPVYFSSVRKWGYHSGPRTWAQGVRKVPPGAHIRIDARDLSMTVDDQFDIVQPDPFLNLREELEDAVRRRVMSSDVPVAALVSGGLDSSIVYQLARQLAPLRVYHVENDERAQLDLLRPTEEVTFIEGSDQVPDLDKILYANEGPVDLGSMVQQYRLGEAIYEDVCLSGDGADELFGGYRRIAEYDSQGSDIYDELVHYHLPRLDKMMMAHTVELRNPFLARGVLSAALALPYPFRMNKKRLKEDFSDILPKGIVEAPKKPLKGPQVLEDPIVWREYLIKSFQKMIHNYQETGEML